MKETRRQIGMPDSWESEDPLRPLDGYEEKPVHKQKWPRALAVRVAEELLVALAPACVSGRCVVAGSLRRGKELVGDVEIVFVPRMEQGPRVDMFAPAPMVAATLAVFSEQLRGVIEKRRNVNGSEMWGEKNKLAVYVGPGLPEASGMPVDFFETTEEAFWNYLVCRTGGKENNLAICNAARAKGWKWNPYGTGFSRGVGLGLKRHVVASEEEVFAFVGMRYFKPEERR